VTTFRVLPTVTNEDCATATTITGAGTFDLHNVVRYASSVDNDIALPDGAFSSLNCPTTLSSVTNDTWYRWVAPASGPVSFQVRQYPKPMVGGRLAFYSAGPGNTCPTSVASNLIKCLPFGTPYPDSGAVTFTPTAGQEYYIQFCSTQGTSSEPFGWVVLDINQNPTIGRCCVASACVLTSSTDCTARAGTYGGDGTLCAAPTATTHTYTGSGGPLPDGTSSDLNSGGTFTSTINVPDSFSIADVEVGLSIAHGKYGDLRITLSKGGRTLILSDRGRRGFTPADAATKALVGPGSYRFADSGSQSWFDVGNAAGTSIPSGTYKTAAAAGVSPGFQKTFNGMSSSGIWTLTITDEALNNTGTLSAWTLTLKQGTPAGCTTPGVCCRGSTCNASVPQASCTTSGALAGAVFTTSAAVCGSNAASPCCFADYNKLNGLSVQDIFDFLNDWFAGRPYAIPGGNGSSGTLAVQNIFDFLNAWFAGGC
jgi:subtilisin-like proprotein convertase family protein